MSHFSFCKMSQCRPTFFHSQTAHKYAAKKGLFWHTETIVQYCKPACSMMAATVKRLRLGWTLWPASLMLNPWLRTWSTTVAWISFEITILLLLSPPPSLSSPCPSPPPGPPPLPPLPLPPPSSCPPLPPLPLCLSPLLSPSSS